MQLADDALMSAKVSTRSGIGWLVVATLVAAGLRCFRLDQNSLWLDEYMSLVAARPTLGDIPAVALSRHALNPPVYFWLLHPVMRMLGEGEAAVRLVSVVAGVLTVPVLWLLVREVTRTNRVANISALLLAVHPLHLWYSQEARPYALLLLFVATALYCLAAALRGRGPWWWTGFAVSTALALLTQVFGVVILLVGATWVGFRARDRGVLRRFAAAALGAVVLTTPLLVMLLRAAAAVKGTGSPPRPTTGLEVPYTIFTFVAGYSFGPSVRELQDLGARAAILGSLAQVALVSLVIVALGWSAARLRSAAARDFAMVLLVPVALAMAGSLITTKPYSVRYALPALLGFVPLIGLALARLAPAGSRIGCGALLVLLLWADVQWFAVPRYRKEDTRAVVACLGQVLPPGATVLVAPGHMASVVRHYSKRDRAAPLRVVGLFRRENLDSTPTAEALLLTRLGYVKDPAGLRQAFAGQGHPSQASAVAIGYQVYLADAARAVRAEECRRDE